MIFSDIAHAQDTAVSEQSAAELAGQAEDFKDRAPGTPGSSDEAIPPSIQAAEPAAAAPPSADISFDIQKVIFEGHTVFSTAELDSIAAPLIGRNVKLADLQKVAAAVTDRYRTAGYINSRAYIAPQKITDGTVIISILETRLSRVTVSGARHFSQSFLEEAASIDSAEPLRYSAIEDRIRFINRNPDLELAAYLAPGETPGTTDIQLKAEDRFPFHASYEYDNSGTKMTHRGRHMISAYHNNFFGRADTLSGTAALSEEGALTAYTGAWSMPFWRTGTIFQLSGSHVNSLLVKHLKSSEIEGVAWSLTPSITQELLMTSRSQLVMKAALEIKDSKLTVDDLKAGMDRLRVLVAGPRWTLHDAGGRTTFSADVHWGIPNFLGGSEAEDLRAARAGTGGDFDYYTASAVRVQRLPLGLTGVGRLSGQWADSELPSMEQIRIGGANSVRGYPESDSSGDYGFMGSAEILASPPVPEGLQLPLTNERWKDVVRLAGFFDAGKIFDHGRPAATAVKDRMLMGAGLGVRVDLKNSFSLHLDHAWPLGDDSTDKVDQSQTHLSVRSGF